MARAHKAPESLSLLKEILHSGERQLGCKMECWSLLCRGKPKPTRMDNMMLNAVLTACAKQRDPRADVVLREMHEALLAQ